MDKKQLIEFLKKKSRGVYPLMVKMFEVQIISLGPAMALSIIKQDLEKEANEDIDINYTSLAHAIRKHKINLKLHEKPVETKKFVFRDAHEIKEEQIIPGSFTLRQDKAGKSKDPESKAS